MRVGDLVTIILRPHQYVYGMPITRSVAKVLDCASVKIFRCVHGDISEY